MRFATVLTLACGLAHPIQADNLGTLNPEEGGLNSLEANIALHPDRIGMLCWIAYEIQKGGGKESKPAAEVMTTCAKNGNAPSMIMLAHAYENGLGVEKDLTQATYWLHEAAQTGYSLAEYHYGMALFTGSGTTKDHAAARLWLKRAVEHGSDAAREALSQFE
ncbi:MULTISPECIES: tetratricopeptide repeat protein [Roseobacteraceae]|uniref:tetratricopeptide repeat protein n=1 Tax=Roseobacteraceae TaxID=2854170 RepID=UPI00186A9EF1|nr:MULTISPECIES: tetratricopeptide repeat protein [Roseobacteraceae]|tara:strand:- start:4088 stop:4576 length:489 start_codon:yes stop_codon:yes gene_type:complete